jgi:hypothetical protein
MQLHTCVWLQTTEDFNAIFTFLLRARMHLVIYSAQCDNA